MTSPTQPPGRLRVALSDRLYRAVRWLSAARRPTLIGADRLPAGPAIYLANHAGPQGPIAVVRALPVRVHPWIIDELLSLRTAPRRMWLDVGRRWRVGARLGRAVCTLTTLLAVPLQGAQPGARARPTAHSTAPTARAWRSRQGRSVLIFPEEAAPDDAPLDAADDSLRPFGAGFAWLCARHLREVAPELALAPLIYRPDRATLEVLPPLRLTANDLRDRSPRDNGAHNNGPRSRACATAICAACNSASMRLWSPPTAPATAPGPARRGRAARRPCSHERPGSSWCAQRPAHGVVAIGAGACRRAHSAP